MPMGEIIKQTGNEMMERWHHKMPRFFYWLVVIACGIGGTAFAINTGVPALGGQLHEWWTDIYSYVVGGCIGTIVVCKFTVAGGYKHVNPDNLMKGKHVMKSDNEESKDDRNDYNG